MKKLMFAVSAALCATVGFSDVTSQNVVGYNTVEKGAVMYPSVAACFVPVGGGSTFKLKEFVPTGMMGSLNDMIQVLNPATTVVDPSNQYIYVSLEECRDIDPTGGLDAMAGWWIGSIGGTSANEIDVPAGTAFLGLILSGTDPITYQFPSVLAD